MGVVDVAAWIGGYPYRHLADPTPVALLKQMDRLAIERAWVGYLPAALYRDPASSNPELLRLLEPHRDRLLPVPAINPAFPRWVQDLNDAVAVGAPAVRVYPNYLGLELGGAEMRVFGAAAGAAGMPLLLTVRLEDLRQRHPLDQAGELAPSGVRALVRSDAQLRILVSHAERSFIEEVHWGLTPDEAARVLWDIVWVWGPPEDHLATLIETMGAARFTFGTGAPLRIPDTPFAKMDLLDLSAVEREQISGGNLLKWKG